LKGIKKGANPEARCLAIMPGFDNALSQIQRGGAAFPI